MAGWNRIDQTPIPIGIGRIWLADDEGNVQRAMSWTWPILKRRDPRKYRQWTIRAQGAKEYPPTATQETPGNTSPWHSLAQMPVPLGAGRIWLADGEGTVIRAMSWTWPGLKRKHPGKFRKWMLRAQGAKETPPT